MPGASLSGSPSLVIVGISGALVMASQSARRAACALAKCTVPYVMDFVSRNPMDCPHRAPVACVGQNLRGHGAMSRSTENFFDDTFEQSIVKATIVEKYFDAWAAIITGAQNKYRNGGKIGYVDLFAGPGRYKTGAISTPLKVVERAIAKYRDRFVSIFNDKDEDNVGSLKREIEALAGYDTLLHKPKIWNSEVGEEIATKFASITKIPILAFIDPWGYKGLTLKLVDAFLRDWGCDCIFFFNYSRINAGLSNDKVKAHMDALFGEERAAELRTQLEPMGPQAREATIVDALARALKAYGHRYVLPFCFKNDQGTRTKHHLILVTKSFKGYEVMKEIMAKSSSGEDQGVASFTYCPADSTRQQLLFELNRPLDGLRAALLSDFAGKTLSMRQIYEAHSVDRPFLARNYKTVLKEMELAKQITTQGRKSSQGFADTIMVTFPKQRA